MRDLIETALRGHDGDYCEIRVEESASTSIMYRGKELEDIGATTGIGGNVRAVVKGGWGFVSFNDLDDLDEKVSLAVRQARLAAQTETRLAEVEPVVGVAGAEVESDAADISLADKKAIMDEYVDAAWSVSDKIQTSQIYYSDAHKKKYFANSDGTYTEQDRMYVRTGGVVIARDNGEVQQGRTSRASTSDFNIVRGLHGEFEKAAQSAVSLLDAEPAKSGEFTVVLDPTIASVFIHEAFGHLSEADHVYENPKLRDLLVLGDEIASPILTVADSAAEASLSGSYKYDDEGTPSRKNYLIQDGRLVGRLHSRETAGNMDEPPTGNARAITYRFPPIVRMTNTSIEAGETSFEDLLGDVADGGSLVTRLGGQ
ncbi:MAG: TldD/PmbA family protein, partial [Chloroflexi bacterium]|nr:TldD/PmbA family protein [Chloroflexota bacterium]